MHELENQFGRQLNQPIDIDDRHAPLLKRILLYQRQHLAEKHEEIRLKTTGSEIRDALTSMEGLLTHVGTADCFIALPHPALECGIVTAWWQCQVEGDPAIRRRQQEDEQRQRHLRSEFSVSVTHPLIG